MYTVKLMFYLGHPLQSECFILTELTNNDCINLLWHNNHYLNERFYNHTDESIASFIKMYFREKQVVRYLQFIEENGAHNVRMFVEWIKH